MPQTFTPPNPNEYEFKGTTITVGDEVIVNNGSVRSRGEVIKITDHGFVFGDPHGSGPNFAVSDEHYDIDHITIETVNP